MVGAISALLEKDYVIIQKKTMTHGSQESNFGTVQKPSWRK
jgi:orotate phosphoribosyltransferase